MHIEGENILAWLAKSLQDSSSQRGNENNNTVIKCHGFFFIVQTVNYVYERC